MNWNLFRTSSMILLIISCWIFQIQSSNAHGITEQHIRQIWHVRLSSVAVLLLSMSTRPKSTSGANSAINKLARSQHLWDHHSFFIIWWVMCYCILYILLVTLYFLLSLIHIAPYILHLSTDYFERRRESFRWISVFKDTLYILLLPLRI